MSLLDRVGKMKHSPFFVSISGKDGVGDESDESYKEYLRHMKESPDPDDYYRDHDPPSPVERDGWDSPFDDEYDDDDSDPDGPDPDESYGKYLDDYYRSYRELDRPLDDEKDDDDYRVDWYERDGYDDNGSDEVSKTRTLRSTGKNSGGSNTKSSILFNNYSQTVNGRPQQPRRGRRNV